MCHAHFKFMVCWGIQASQWKTTKSYEESAGALGMTEVVATIYLSAHLSNQLSIL